MGKKEEVKHTPGPWTFDGCVVWGNDPDRHCAVADLIGEAAYISSPVPKEHLAPNGYLIAAAPELLEALQELLIHIEDNFDEMTQDETFLQAQLAIAKAEGKL